LLGTEHIKKIPGIIFSIPFLLEKMYLHTLYLIMNISDPDKRVIWITCQNILRTRFIEGYLYCFQRGWKKIVYRDGHAIKLTRDVQADHKVPKILSFAIRK
jgi:hypothetical protein